ncbi:NAD-binding Rossmann fold oxidoreductase family protein [Corynespora cassiicola Philippines]|uniref:NAD-binding Rossmann fold oxidoreductase family protein n=1 Tax=Corynespora cassiicola Philippines TaxID=1448308 RepID=A0A2T2N112_CORCC|nr:NAD-binding Rossmann fold oxidoreductase family protein [Corynespora cassiicola Philippines]
MCEPKRIGLIGLSAKGSWASRSHLGYLQNSRLYTISALRNSSKAAAEASAKAYSLENITAHDNPSAIASDPNVDIVAVSVNVLEHYNLIRPALEAGKIVFSEWPLARNLAEAEELTHLAKEKGVRTMVGLQARQDPSILKTKAMVASGKLGRIIGSTMYGHAILFGSLITENFRVGLPIENGVNLVTVPFGHAVDALCFVLGELKDISATVANNNPEVTLLGADLKPSGEPVAKTSHDYISMTGTLVEGNGIVNVTYAPGLSRTNRDFVWEINGTEGSLLLEGGAMGGHIQMYQPTIKLATYDPEAALYGVEGGASQKLEEVQIDKAPDFSYNTGKAWEALAGIGLDEGQSVTIFEDALVRHRMIDAIYRSARQGTRENYL